MNCLIIGAGGHGMVVLDILRARREHHPIGFLDADPSLGGSVLSDLPVLGAANLLPKLRGKARGGIVAIGDNRARMEYARLLLEHGYELLSAIHPTAHVSDTASLGPNAVVCAGALISTGARLGGSVIINTGAIVDHECEIGDGVHVAPGAAVAGRVRIETGAFIGLGSRIIQCIHVGQYATVGAGAVVIRDVPPQSTVAGVPAHPLRSATGVSQQMRAPLDGL